jgi:PAS domain S-box-containing protein
MGRQQGARDQGARDDEPGSDRAVDGGESGRLLTGLTRREVDVLRLIGEGLSTAQIAARLHRSEWTIKSHRVSLGRKLGVSNRVALARVAIESGLVRVGPGPSDPKRAMLLELAADSSSTGLAITDEKLRILYANRACADLVGVAVEELIGRPLGVLHRHDSLAGGDDVLDALALTGGYEHLMRTERGGASRQVRLRFALLRAEGGRTSGVGVSLRSDTESPPPTLSGVAEFAMDNRDAIRAERDRFIADTCLRGAMASSHDALISADGAGRIRYVSPGAERSFGAGAPDMHGRSVERLVPAVDRADLSRAVASASAIPATIELRARREDGEVFPAKFTIVRAGDTEDSVVSIAVRDLTPEISSGLAQRSLEMVLEMIDEAIVVTDMLGRIKSWSAGAQRLYGYAPQEVAGESLTVLLEGGLAPRRLGEVLAQLRSHGSTTIVGGMRTKLGRSIGATAQLRTLTGPDGHPAGVVWCASNARQADEEATRPERSPSASASDLADQSSILRSVFEATGAALAVADADGRILYVNPAYERLFGWSAHQATDVPRARRHPPETIRVIEQEMRPAVTAGRGWSGKVEALDATGRRLPVRMRCDAVRDETGSVLLQVALMHDARDETELAEATCD